MASPYILTQVLVGHIGDEPNPARSVGLYIDIDSGAASFSDGSSWRTIAGSGGSATDATTSAVGVVRVDHAPSGAHPVALTTDGIALPTGMIGTASTKAAAGNDARLSDTRTPTDGSVTTGKLADGAVTDAKTSFADLVASATATIGTTLGINGASADATNPVTSGDGAGNTTASLDPHGSLTLGNATAAGAIGALSIQGGDGQTHAPINVANSIGQNKFTVAIDGEVVTADDVLAPSGQVKGQTVGFYPLGTTGAPSTGTHAAGEMVMDSAGAVFVCTASGTPGTWGQITIA